MALFDDPALEAARAAAALHLAQQGFTAESMAVAEGRGDDFAEVRMALSLWAILRLEGAARPLRRDRRLIGEEC